VIGEAAAAASAARAERFGPRTSIPRTFSSGPFPTTMSSKSAIRTPRRSAGVRLRKSRAEPRWSRDPVVTCS